MRVLTLILFFLIPFSLSSLTIELKISNNDILNNNLPYINGSPVVSRYIDIGKNTGISNYTYLFFDPETLNVSIPNEQMPEKYLLSENNKLVLKGVNHYKNNSFAIFQMQPYEIINENSIILYKRIKIDIITYNIYSNDFATENRIDNRYLNSISSNAIEYNIVKKGDTSYVWQKPEGLPVLGDPPVDYVIITNSIYKDSFKNYEHFWLLMGLRTTIVTLDNITVNYDGSFLQEKIRNFIKDAASFWGTHYILLAGDNSDIPPIYFHNDFYGTWLDSPTDMYYSCLNGNWNLDFDYYLGESPEDSVDLIPDIALGRLSINSNEDISYYLNKLKKYILYPDISLIERAIFIGPNVFSSGDGKMWCDTIADYHFPENYYKPVLSEVDGTSAPGNSNQAVIDSINTGFHFYYHNSHGSHNQIQLKNASPRVYITNEDCNSFHNIFPNISFIVSCYTNEFIFDVLSEHFVMQEFGSIAFIASINNEYPYPAMYFQKPFFDSLFNSSFTRLGDILNIGKMPILSYAQSNGVYRHIYMFENLQGDPALPVWKQKPKNITVTLPDTIVRGDSIDINIFSQNLYPKVNCYIITPDSNFIHKTFLPNQSNTLYLRLNRSGIIHLSFLQEGKIPVLDSIIVSDDSNFIAFSDVFFSDSLSKYPNDKIENGDTVIMKIPLVYTLANNHNMLIRTTKSIKLIDSTLYLPASINPDSVMTSFKLFIPDSLTQKNIPIEISISDIYLDTIHMFVKTENFIHAGHIFEHIEANIYNLTINISNTGLGNAYDYQYSMWYYSNRDSVIDSVYGFLPPIIESDSSYLLGPFDINVPVNINRELSDITFSLHLQGVSKIFDYNFNYDTLPTPLFETSMPYRNSIELFWNSIDKYSGFDLYIYDESIYRKINRELIDGGSYYTVNDLEQDSTYIFKLIAYDSLMNSSDSSDIYCEATNPLEFNHWPFNNNDIGLTSPIPGDFNDNGYIDLFLSLKSGKLILLSSSGDTLPGWPQYIENEIWGTPAVADVDGDGRLEILISPWSSTNKVYLFNDDGTICDGWPKYVQGDSTNKGLYGVAGSPVIRDIDNDSIPEIIISATNGDIFIWQPNGDGYYRSDGLFARREGDNWDLNVASAQDLNRDGVFEIYVLSRSGIFYAFSTTDYDTDSLAIILPGFPDTLLGGTYYQPTAGNIGPSSDMELCLVAENNLYLFDSELNIYPNFPVLLTSDVFISQPMLIDIDGDSLSEIILTAGDYIYAFDYMGHSIPNYPIYFGKCKQSHPVSAILNDTSFIFIGTGDLDIKAYSIFGKKLNGFPIRTYDNFYSAPAINPGLLTSIDYSSNSYLWHIKGLNKSTWPSIFHDYQHTGDATFAFEFTSGIKRNIIIKDANTNISYSKIGDILIFKGVPPNQSVEIDLYNIAGRNIHFKQIDNHSISLKGLRNGIYFVKINSLNTKCTFKFLYIK
jgi:hypothetical protein